MNPSDDVAAIQNQSSSTQLLAGLRDAAGAEVVVSDDASDIASHSQDRSGMQVSAKPLAVVYPRSAADVSRILKFCNEQRLSVVPQGGLTGMVGGAMPLSNEVLVSLERMREIEEVDSAALTMRVQAGAPLQKIQMEAERLGLSFPLDYGSRGSCTIGGAMATNAGGNRVLRFGMARDLALGLEVVLADGTIMSSLNKMLKNNAGYDLKQVFIGSEGTLGVITRVVLRLLPMPSSSTVVLCACTTYADVLDLLELARGRLGGNLTAFEVMWNDFYTAVTRDRSRVPLASTHEFYTLLEIQSTDGHGDGLFDGLIEEAFEQGHIVDAALAKSAAEMADIWSIRDSSGELDRLLGNSVHFDVSVPVAHIADFIVDCRTSLQAALPGATAVVFGHIADSNIHLAARTPDAIQPKDAIDQVVYACVARWAGSISAEHGIGVTKRKYLPLSRSAEELQVMRILKSALDPHNILNPGKVIPLP